MKTLTFKQSDFDQAIDGLATGSSLFSDEVEARVRRIVKAVQARGDEALLGFTRRFDRVSLQPHQLRVSVAELLTAAAGVDESTRQALRTAHRNILRFSRRSLRHSWSMRNAQGGIVGEKYDPFQRVGIYVPGGTAPLVSTALMTVTLAQAAGCPEIVVCTPPGGSGTVNGSLLYALGLAGATEIYRIGGAQAIAALACGTASVPRVQKVFGPGNAYVVAAKRLLFGRVAVDLLPGPSEVLVLADDTADAAHVAADLLAQAEHGSGHERVWLVTSSAPLLTAVRQQIQRQLPALERRAHIERALAAHGALILVRDPDQAVAIANRLAPEHCEIMARDRQALAGRITTAGALFLGAYSPTVLGDYVAGPSHTLPTGGAGRCFSGLTVDQFQRRTSVVTYDRPALQRSLPAVRAFAAMEGLQAHGQSAEQRFLRVRASRLGPAEPPSSRARPLRRRAAL
jgi:histidinol dehydrogenase